MNSLHRKMVLRKLIPLVYAQSLVDLVRINHLFPNLRRASIVFRTSFLFITYFFMIICGMNIDLFEKYHPAVKGSMGEIGERILAALSITFLEVFIVRIWLIHLDRGRGRLEEIDFFKVLKQMRQDESEKWLAKSKIASLCLYIVSLLTCQSMTIFQLVSLDLDWDDRLIRVIWIIASIFMVEWTMHDLPILYTIVMASVAVIEDKAQNLLFHLRNLDSRRQSKSKICLILLKYKNLVKSISRVNTISKFLITVGKVLAIPLFSAFLFAYLTPVSSRAHIIIKYIASIAGIVYTVRIFFLIGYLSRMTCLSNQIYSLCASKAARETSRERVFIVKKLTAIMEDIAGPKNQLLFQEFSGEITPLDLVESIMSTFSFLALFFSLRNTLTKA